jgi:hypothetical protein
MTQTRKWSPLKEKENPKMGTLQSPFPKIAYPQAMPSQPYDQQAETN